MSKIDAKTRLMESLKNKPRVDFTDRFVYIHENTTDSKGFFDPIQIEMITEGDDGINVGFKSGAIVKFHEMTIDYFKSILNEWYNR